MISAPHPSRSRCLAVWAMVSAGALTVSSTVVGAAGSLASSPVWRGTFEDLLVAVASAALLACSGWVWLVATATVVDLLRSPAAHVAPRSRTRRLVLAACGAAALAGVAGPAAAAGVGWGADRDTGRDIGRDIGSAAHSLTGLPMPDRAVATAVAHPPRAVTSARLHPPDRVTVQPGDSLWSIAAATLGADARPAEIDEAWRALYAANRDAIGTDPDLIRPGLDLTVDPTRKAQP